MLQFICVRFNFLRLFRIVVYLCMCGFVVLDLVSSVLCQEIGWEDNQFMYSVVRRKGFPDSTNSLDPPLILTLLRYIIALYWLFL